MPRRKPKYKETAWIPDLEKWRKLLDKKQVSSNALQLAPKGGWQLFRWDTLEDVPQDEKSRPC